MNKAIVPILVIFNLVLLFLVVRAPQKAAPNKSSALHLHEQMDIIEGTVQPDKPFTLYVFFHGDGQCGCLEDWSNWAKLQSDFQKQLNVVGVYNGQDLESFTQFAQGVGLDIPLFIDPTYAVHKNLGISRYEVVKVLVHESGAILLRDTQQERSRDQLAFAKRVEAHIKRITGTEG